MSPSSPYAASGPIAAIAAAAMPDNDSLTGSEYLLLAAAYSPWTIPSSEHLACGSSDFDAYIAIPGSEHLACAFGLHQRTSSSHHSCCATYVIIFSKMSL